MTAREPSRCVAPLDDGGHLCGKDAETTREVAGLVMPLCAEHARELDDENAARDARTN